MRVGKWERQKKEVSQGNDLVSTLWKHEAWSTKQFVPLFYTRTRKAPNFFFSHGNMIFQGLWVICELHRYAVSKKMSFSRQAAFAQK